MNDIRSQYHRELDEIRVDIARLGAMVAETIPRGTEALLGNDLGDAKAVIEGDDPIDALSLAIEERCYRVLALQQPMASDLRAIITAIRLVSEIERSGDLMVNVAKASRRLYRTEFDPRLRGMVSRMAEEAQKLFQFCIDAYFDGDADKAAALDDMDDKLDQLHKQFIQAIFESHRAANLDLESGVQLALVGRYYERIGDHAVNIGQRVTYMVTGWLPEQTGAYREAARHAAETAKTSEVPAADAGTADGPVIDVSTNGNGADDASAPSDPSGTGG